jgi:small Trp-rich protein
MASFAKWLQVRSRQGKPLATLDYSASNAVYKLPLTLGQQQAQQPAALEPAMFFILVGVLLLVLRFAGVSPMADWNLELFGDLWKLVLPFILALVWWAWADASGLTKRREMKRDELRKSERRARNIENLGLGPKDPKKPR